MARAIQRRSSTPSARRTPTIRPTRLSRRRPRDTATEKSADQGAEAPPWSAEGFDGTNIGTTTGGHHPASTNGPSLAHGSRAVHPPKPGLTSNRSAGLMRLQPSSHNTRTRMATVPGSADHAPSTEDNDGYAGVASAWFFLRRKSDRTHASAATTPIMMALPLARISFQSLPNRPSLTAAPPATSAVNP